MGFHRTGFLLLGAAIIVGHPLAVTLAAVATLFGLTPMVIYPQIVTWFPDLVFGR